MKRTGVLERYRQLRLELAPYQKSMLQWWLSVGMRAKLSLLLTGLILTMSGFFYLFALYQTTREIKISAIYKGQAIAEALKNEVAYSLLSRNFNNINTTFRRLAASRNDVAYIFLIDNQGKILAHNESDMISQFSGDAQTKKVLASNSMRVQFEKVDLDGQGELSDLCDIYMPIYLQGKRAGILRIGISLTQYLLSNGPRIRKKIALFVVPLGFLSILLAMKLAESYTRPLKHLAQAAAQLSDGNFSVHLPLSRTDEIGEVAQAFNVMAHHLKENFEKVSDMANRDGLTGLYNARYFHEALARELERCRRMNEPLSLLIFDADRFKRVNDRYGHPVGDQILQHVSRIGRSVLRGYDLLARYGGEEFIAMLTNTQAEQAALLGERLRKAVEQKPYITDDGATLRVTISIGIAQASDSYDKKEVITQADQALYQAKESGRNRVVVSQAAVS